MSMKPCYQHNFCFAFFILDIQKGSMNSMSTIYTTLSFLFLFSINFRDVFGIPTIHLCRPEQRNALLEFKNEFEIRNSSSAYYSNNSGSKVSFYSRTESWKNNTNCCYWDGITCDAKTGKVVELDLSCSRLHGRFHSNSFQNLGSLTVLDLSSNDLNGQIFFSVRKLSYLTSLRVNSNQFSGQIPSSIGKLFRLTSLALTDNQFSGQIPSSIGNLSHLTSLRLSTNQFSGRIPYSMGNLSRLVNLSLSGNNFVGEIPSTFGSLYQLALLRVNSNNLSGNFPLTLLNSTNLSYLSLSYNQFTGTLPPNITSFSNLEYFDVDNNAFFGTFPSLTNNQLNDTLFSASRLRGLSLGSNNFRGPIPRSISKLVNLESLDMSHWNTQGPVDFNIFSHLKSLTYLDLSYLNTTTEIDLSAISSFSKSLDTLDLSGNPVLATNKSSVSDPPSKLIRQLLLGGCGITEFPELLRTQQHLAFLNMSSNKMKGQVPGWLWTLPNLWSVNLANNNFIGMERSIKHGLSPRLLTLDMSNNEIKGQVPGWLWMFPNLDSLSLSNNKIKGQVPGWLWKLSNLKYLDLSNNTLTGFERSTKHGQSPELQVLDISNNKFKGQVPGWLWTLPCLYNLDLSNNNFIGFERPTIRGISSALWYFLGSKNNFTGNIPSLICELRSLIALDLSVNYFSGSVPHCLENLKSNLSYLNLRHDHLTGGLPKGAFKSLRSLDVGHNQLVGKLPRSLMNFSALEVLNVGNNRINDMFPLWLSSLRNLQILVLRSNAFYGPIHQASFLKLKIIDISNNQFNGTLPTHYFVGWSEMSSLGTNNDQSTEKYMGDESGFYKDSIVLESKGTEIEIVRILKILTALDFSENRFEGDIPDSIGLLKELRSLSLSNNAFTGHIPLSIGNLTSLESLDVSQNKLSGEIPQELGTLSFLSYMNFANNQLVGPVPGGTQFRTQPCSSFANNSGLFGTALDEACSDIHTPSQEQYETRDAKENEEEEEVFSWIAAVIGFGPGIAFGLTIGYILVSHKPEWFTSPFGRNKRKSRRTATR